MPQGAAAAGAPAAILVQSPVVARSAHLMTCNGMLPFK